MVSLPSVLMIFIFGLGLSNNHFIEARKSLYNYNIDVGVSQD